MRPEQCRSARALLDWSQKKLGAEAGVSGKTVNAFESAERSVSRTAVSRLRATLVVAGIAFIEDDDGYGVRKAAARTEDGTAAPSRRPIETTATKRISSGQLRAARGFLGWSQTEAARHLQVGPSLIVAIESETREQFRARNLEAIVSHFAERGLTFETRSREGVELSRSVTLEVDGLVPPEK